MKLARLWLLAFLLSGCGLLTPRPSGRPPLTDQGALFLYLEPWPDGAGRLSVTLSSVTAVRSDGVPVPLELALTDLPGPDAKRQRLLASAQLPPGAYRGLEVTAARARVIGGEGPADLLIGKEPTSLEAPFEIAAGQAKVLTLTLRYEASLPAGVTFVPRFLVGTPPRPPPILYGFCSNTNENTLTLFERRQHEVFRVLATGRAPRGLALGSPPSTRLFVAVEREDEIQPFEITGDLPLPPLKLVPGDRPWEVALSPDARTLLVLNNGSNSLAFLDAASGAERGRVAVGISPISLLVDRSWRRAYVLNDVSSSITVVDLATRKVFGSIPTGAGPLRAQLNRAGDKLYVIASGSPQLQVFSVPAFTMTSQITIGLGATALKVDPRTDLVYVAKQGEHRVYVYDSFSLIPIDSIDLPGDASWFAIDDTENALLALMPSLRGVAAVDLASHRVLGVIPVGDEPYEVTVADERY